MRMRTINEASAYLTELDPETALTKTALRRLVINGSIPSVRVGNKYLIALENLEAFLCNEKTTSPGEKITPLGVIRPIEVRK